MLHYAECNGLARSWLYEDAISEYNYKNKEQQTTLTNLLSECMTNLVRLENLLSDIQFMDNNDVDNITGVSLNGD